MQQYRRGSGLIIGLVALGLLAGAALTASPAQAATGTGPYYAPPAWDRKLPTATRFVVLTNWNSEAVLDKETGLVWERSPDAATSTWFEQTLACTNRTIGTRKGWRLPSVHELGSLLHPEQGDPALPLGHPFTNVQSAAYWSATTTAGDPTRALALDIAIHGGLMVSRLKLNVFPAWCVRGGNNADQY